MSPLRLILLWAALLWAALLPLQPAQAQDVQPVPPLSARVIDQTGTLTAEQASALEAKLAAFEAKSGPQIVVLVVPTAAPEDIASYAQRVADAWKIGRRDVGDGLLIVVAKNERRVRIEVAKALEGAIPDLAARQIIDSAVRPAFRADDYAGGLNAAVDRLMQRIKGEGLAEPAARKAPGGLGSQVDDGVNLLFFAFVFVLPWVNKVLTAIFGRRWGSLMTVAAASALTWWITTAVLVTAGASLVSWFLFGVLGWGAAGNRGASAGGWGGWSSDSGGGGSSWGGGGFSSGGGGDFGGGGASGDW